MEILCDKFESAREFKMKKGYENFFMQIYRQKPICIFGGGSLGKQICGWLLNNGIRPKCFCDNNPALHRKEILEGIQCISFNELLKYKEDIYLIVAVGDRIGNDAVNWKLKEFKYIMRNPLGLSAYWCQTFDLNKSEFVDGVRYVLDHVEDAFSQETFEVLVNLRLQDCVIDYPLHLLTKYYCRDQYIPKEIMDFSKIRTYVDCGAYTGDSLETFISLGTDADYYCFEMDHTIFDILEHNAKKNPNSRIHLYPYGVGKMQTVVPYISNSTGGSKISDYGSKQAKIVPLDDMSFKQKIDYIKMDIEGAEEEAIEGAVSLIQKDHPVLAISIYHNFSQLVGIVRMIKNLDPRYRIYIRHHKYTLDDTLCYAVYI